MKKICCLCRVVINEKDTYFKIELHHGGELIGTDFCHKRCRDERDNMQNKLNNLVDGIGNFATRQGIIPEKKVVIK